MKQIRFVLNEMWVWQITFTILVRVLMSMGPGEELEALRREFEEFIKALVCVPIKFPGTRLYKSLKVKCDDEIYKITRVDTADGSDEF